MLVMFLAQNNLNTHLLRQQTLACRGIQPNRIKSNFIYLHLLVVLIIFIQT